jgi:hypothetical protein
MIGNFGQAVIRVMRRDIDTIAEDVVLLGNHVPEIDPDAGLPQEQALFGLCASGGARHAATAST